MNDYQRKRRSNRLATLTNLLLVSTSASIMAPTSVYAQSDGGARGAASTLSDSVIVTARRKEEALDDLPLSVSAYSSESLEVRGITQIDSLGTLSPNITFQNNPSFGGSSNSAAIRIRGIGSADFTPTTDPGVGVYVDGVYYARSVGSILDILEFDRVEVLRGPQGTLFGRNTIGGAINITSKKPDAEFGGKASFTYGSDEWIDFTGSINIPLSDTLFVKLSGGTFNQDGYVRRADGIDLGDDSTLAGRVDVRWEPSDRFSADFSIDASRDRENGPAMQLIDIRYGGQTIDPTTPPFVLFNNVAAVFGGAVPNPLPPLMGPPPQCATDAAPLNLANALCFDDRYIGAVDGVNQGAAPSFSDSDIFGAALTLEYDLTDQITIKSITSYREVFAEFGRDGDHSPIVVSQFFDDFEQDQISQEIQILGEMFDGQLDWIAGFYYFKENGTNINLLDFIVSSFRSGGDFDNQSLAAFGQATWDITDRLHLTAGVRWTEDTKKFTPDQVIFTLNPNVAGFLSPPQQFIFQPGTPILPSLEATREISEVTPMVNVSYDVTNDLMVYGLFSQGFKSGGFTQRVLPPLIPGITCLEPEAVDCIPGFEPEFVDVYEGGFRYALPNNRLRISASGFYSDYQSLQIAVFTSVAPVVNNAGAASIVGAEVEFQAIPFENFFIEGSAGYTDAEYDSIDAATRVDINNEFERVSKWSGNIGASYDFFVGNWVATPRVDWSYRSRYFNDAFNSPQIAQDGFSLVDLNLGVRNDEGLSLQVGVKNVTDKQYLAAGVFGDAFEAFEGVYDRGRQWFVRVGIEY